MIVCSMTVTMMHVYLGSLDRWQRLVGSGRMANERLEGWRAGGLEGWSGMLRDGSALRRVGEP